MKKTIKVVIQTKLNVKKSYCGIENCYCEIVDLQCEIDFFTVKQNIEK